MYQALVRLPAHPTENGAQPPQAHLDWRALLRSLMRLFTPRHH